MSFTPPRTNFANPINLLESESCLTGEDGKVSDDGDSVTDIHVPQLQLPDGCFADISNPLLLWKVKWYTGDFTPRTVALETLTTEFKVFTNYLGSGEDITHLFSDAHAEIVVGCYPDFDHNGTLDLFDFLEFLNLFNAEDPATDCDASGSFDLFDLLCFVNAFNEGC